MRIISVQEKFKEGNYDCLVLAVSSHASSKRHLKKRHPMNDYDNYFFFTLSVSEV
jgi:hypothetical protein